MKFECFFLLFFFYQVRELDDTAQRLMQTHPDQAEGIYEHQTEINEMWNALTIKVEQSCFSWYLWEWLTDMWLVQEMLFMVLGTKFLKLHLISFC